ncbi:MAG: hypothetical protein IKU49_02545 [Prevotella sp.]|nr:hypothetical protein [Prevotella sp.]
MAGMLSVVVMLYGVFHFGLPEALPDLVLTMLHNHTSIRTGCFLVLPCFAFILGRIALIFQNPLFFTSFFRNFAEK